MELVEFEGPVPLALFASRIGRSTQDAAILTRRSSGAKLAQGHLDLSSLDYEGTTGYNYIEVISNGEALEICLYQVSRSLDR